MKDFKIEYSEENKITINGNLFDSKLENEARDEVCFELLPLSDCIESLKGLLRNSLESDFDLILSDLIFLMGKNDSFVFSSLSTNRYILKSCHEVEFNDKCEEYLDIFNAT